MPKGRLPLCVETGTLMIELQVADGFPISIVSQGKKPPTEFSVVI